MKMIDEFTSRSNPTTTKERKDFHKKIKEALQEAGINDYPMKEPGAKYDTYFAKLNKYLSTLGQPAEENEEDTEIEMLPNIHDDEKVEMRQSERIIELYPSLIVIEEQWIDLENIISLPLEFTILIDSLKKRLRRQLYTRKKTVGFKIVSGLNDHVSRKSYYVYKNSLFTLLCTWNVLSFNSSMALESKLHMRTNQNIERIVEEVRECVISARTTAQNGHTTFQNRSASAREQEAMQKRMFQLFNRFDEFLESSAEAQSRFDIAAILLDIRRNNVSLHGLCQTLLEKYNQNNNQAAQKQQEESLALILRKGKEDIVHELQNTLSFHLDAIERRFLGDLSQQIRDNFMESRNAMENLKREQNKQMMKLFESLTCYHAAAHNTILQASAKSAAEIRNDISTGHYLLIHAMEQLHAQYQQLCKQCSELVQGITYMNQLQSSSKLMSIEK